MIQAIPAHDTNLRASIVVDIEWGSLFRRHTTKSQRFHLKRHPQNMRTWLRDVRKYRSLEFQSNTFCVSRSDITTLLHLGLRRKSQ